MSKPTRKTKLAAVTADTEEFPYRPQKKQRLTQAEFLARHPGFDPETARTKVQISIKLDQEVLEFFKRRAAAPNAAPYQTQINNELRAVMEREQPASPAVLPFVSLVENPAFIQAVAQKVAALQPAAGKRKKAA